MTYKPRIGVTMRLELETRRFYLGRDYTEALEGAGAVPVHLSLIPKEEYISTALDDLDGVLLPGCDSDIDPLYYGGEPHPKLKKVVPLKDETDLLVLTEAERRNLPVLAICYGMQVLNVFRGGSLYQDIESQVENCVKHDQGVPLDRKSHSVRIAGDCLMSELVGAGNNVKKVNVNSHHHQAIRNLGENLAAVAWANDGIVECIQDTRENRYVMGVQWHPEIGWETDVFSKALFSDFVDRCRNGKRVRIRP